MGFNCGIVGLPNVGKSTIFNALTSGKAESANFPFCTIEPNTGVVGVPDSRLNILAELANSAKIIPTTMEFVDIAGLVKGASQGEGLGNQFLGHIRQVDAVLHVVRCFEDENISHVNSTVNPVRDIEIVETELMLADLAAVTKRIEKVRKLAKSQDKDAKLELEMLNVALNCLEEGRLLALEDNFNSQLVSISLLTSKPILYVANVSEENASLTPEEIKEESVKKLIEFSKNRNAEVVTISGAVEAEISELEKEEREEFLLSIGLKKSGLSRLIERGYRLLELITFFTAGPKETRAWTLQAGKTAPEAAGKIHTDFEKGFIRAEVISYLDYIEFKGEQGTKEKGKMRVEGKDYIVSDGDVMHFRFNV